MHRVVPEQPADKRNTLGLPPLSSPMLRRTLRLFRPYRFHVVSVAVLILVTASIGVINPLLIRTVFDSGLFPSSGGPDLQLLWILAAVMTSIAIANGIMGVIQTYMTNHVGQSVMRDLRDSVYAHLQGMSLGFFTSTRTGEIQSRISNDVGGIQAVVTSTLTDTLSNTVIFLSTLVAMLILSWQLTIVAVATVPFFFALTKYVGKKRRAVTSEAQRSMAEVTAITQETLSVSGIMLAKLFGRQTQEMANFHRHNQELSDLAVRQQMIGHSFFAVVMTFLSISPAFIYLLAGYMMSGSGSPAVTAGTIIAFTTLQSRLYFPVGRLLQVSVELQSSFALFERIYGYLDLKQDIVDSPDASPLDLERVSGGITFDSVRVNYARSYGEPSDENSEQELEEESRLWALDGVSLNIPPGQLAAFVGPSGAGKTTLAYLVPRLYDVTEGSVSIDGTDVKEIRQVDLAAVIGFVTQDSYLFHDTMEKNLLYARPEASRDEMIEAAKAAFIHDRIMEMPEGYDTFVGERGFRLSGGERQRLSIARVILHQPRVLILDEATSALDTASERYVQSALQPLMRDRTTMVIAHRLSTIIAADVIYVVDRGRIVEHGPHDELLAYGGLYANLYREQFGGGRIEAYCEDGVIFSDGSIGTAERPEPALTGGGPDAPRRTRSGDERMPWEE
ncbi:MAG: ABC transporter ATP-binding protein [SAR202 cluster bacterium]|nr:ABC transporter ATP-binding protein [SAR202 cluster bacterium]MQG32204.1 ABC transporter ATP-binding protein [SAR202 cluster bacterium]MQG45205.1 ABC transporter ATP-binding protein [SAR202 cluster bacterium]MQG71652.1 ABC transporter ATP-binding protein [SAR202 cluster bacterium]